MKLGAAHSVQPSTCLTAVTFGRLIHSSLYGFKGFLVESTINMKPGVCSAPRRMCGPLQESAVKALRDKVQAVWAFP